MRERLLIVGARPRAFTGPWIDLSDSEVWEVLPRDNYDGEVTVEAQNGAAQLLIPLTDKPIRLDGMTRVRAVINESVKSKHITVLLRQVE